MNVWNKTDPWYCRVTWSQCIGWVTKSTDMMLYHVATMDTGKWNNPGKDCLVGSLSIKSPRNLIGVWLLASEVRSLLTAAHLRLVAARTTEFSLKDAKFAAVPVPPNAHLALTRSCGVVRIADAGRNREQTCLACADSPQVASASFPSWPSLCVFSTHVFLRTWHVQQDAAVRLQVWTYSKLRMYPVFCSKNEFKCVPFSFLVCSILLF